MAENLYTVFFKGEISKGATPDEVQKKLASILRIDQSRIAQAFKGQALVKKDLPRDKALKLVTAFESTGALCQIEVQRQAGPASHPERPPQRPAQRPAQQPPREAEPPFRPTAPQSNHNPEPKESITCAKCGLMQPRGVECVKCGVLFDKIETVTELANDPDKIAREIVESYRPQLRCQAVTLTPAIPHRTALNILAPYLDPNARWEGGEEFIINNDEELIATFDTNDASKTLRSNLLLTNLKMMIYRWTDGPMCAGFDLWSIKKIVLVGENKTSLMVDEKILELPAVSVENQEIRETFIKMTSEIVRALKQADRAARLKAKRAWEADPHGGRPEPGGYSGSGPRKGRITLDSLDLRDLPCAPAIPEADASRSSESSNLLSGVKGLFKKK